jgi:hypothetical protein
MTAAVSYFPPNMRQIKVDWALEELVDALHRMMSSSDRILVVVGGDFNGFDLSVLFDGLPTLKTLDSSPTHISGNNLDKLLVESSFRWETGVCDPLSPDVSTQPRVASDHFPLFATCEIPVKAKPKRVSFWTRPITDQGRVKFQERLSAVNFDFLKEAQIDEAAGSLSDVLWETFEDSFPMKEICRPNDGKPWRDKAQVGMLRKLARIGRKKGRNQEWKQLRVKINQR